MASLETQRQLLEELDTLGVAVAQRFCKNPALVAASGIPETDKVLESKRKRPHKETLLQQHELRYFGNQYRENCARSTKIFEQKDLAKEIASFKDAELKFAKFSSRLEELTQKHAAYGAKSAEAVLEMYSMYLSAPEDARKVSNGKNKVKRRHVLSTAAAHFTSELEIMFNELELYGKLLDLTVFYDMYKVLTQSKDSYVQYLHLFDRFTYGTLSPDYTRYLESLLAYLKKFYQHTHPLGDLDSLLNMEAPKSEGGPEETEDGKANEKGEVFCKACNKTFAKESVYKGHLDGKKHKKNAQTGTPPSALANASLESKIKKLTEALAPIREATTSDHERRSALSERERILENLAVLGNESEFTGESSSDGGSSDDEDGDYLKGLPLGTDGTPIPLWLYKLQGLHRSYLCEICGNASYKGRQQFAKHFNLAKHVHGLSCLGVPEEDMGLFNNVPTIQDAVDLWKSIKRNKKHVEDDAENAVEVEDDDGNVMSHKDYVELKKQGLL